MKLFSREMLQFCVLVAAVSLGFHHAARAKDTTMFLKDGTSTIGPNTVSYRCDTKADQIVITYDDPLPGDQVGENSWQMDSLYADDGDANDLGTPQTVVQSCHLSSGTFEVEVSPEAIRNVQGMCGGDPATGGVSISFNGRTFFDQDFDEQCLQSDPNDIAIDKIIVSGMTKQVTISYSDGP